MPERYSSSTDCDSFEDSLDEDHVAVDIIPPHLPRMTLTQQSNVKFAKKLQKENALHCTSCESFFTSPVYSVHGTGLVCQKCLSKNGLQGERLRIYDVLLKDLPVVPCWNAHKGCEDVALSNKDLIYHMNRCAYRPPACIVPQCKWKNGGRDDFVGHFEEAHRMDVVDEETIFTVDFAERAFSVAKLLTNNTDKCFLLIERGSSGRTTYSAFRVENGRTDNVPVKHHCQISGDHFTRYLDVEHLDMVDWSRVENRINLAILKEKPGDDYELSVTVRVTKKKTKEKVEVLKL